MPKPRHRVEWELLFGDCQKVWPKRICDLIVTDPPYGIGYRGFGHVSGAEVGKHSTSGYVRTPSKSFKSEVGDKIEGDEEVNTEWLKLAYRRLREGGALYLFTRWDVEPKWRDGLEEAGFTVKQRLTWWKRTTGVGDLKRRYGPDCEDVLFATKGDHFLNFRPGMLLDFVKPVQRQCDKHHPHQKPVALLKHLIKVSSKPGDLVVDPFSGSGSTGVAAVVTGRRFIGMEIDKRHYKTAKARLLGTAPAKVDKVTGGKEL